MEALLIVDNPELEALEKGGKWVLSWFFVWVIFWPPAFCWLASPGFGFAFPGDFEVSRLTKELPERSLDVFVDSCSGLNPKIETMKDKVSEM